MIDRIEAKITSWQDAAKSIHAWQEHKLAIVFTNGCFDLLHYGHLHYLIQAKSLGDKLVVGLNSDLSIRRLKGAQRPIQDIRSRSFHLASLEFVDLVVIFEDDTPLKLIERVTPDILVKGGDWDISEIVGSDYVLGKGGKVQTLPFIEGYSTTLIEQKIKDK